MTGDDGGYRFEGLAEGTHELRASADGFDAQARRVEVKGDQRVDFALRRPTPDPPPPTRIFAGSLVEGLSDRPVPNATVEVEGLTPVNTDPEGVFRIEVPEAEAVRQITVHASAIVSRTTHLRIPGPETGLTVIPASFDLAAFDEMFRASGRLQRWTDAPHLSIQTAVLDFTSVNEQAYVATADTMSDQEVESLRDDLAWGIQRLSDNQLGFASERVERPAAGGTVTVARTGEIVVARFVGLEAATGFWGYGRWASDDRGRIQAGIIMLDAGFDSSGSPFQRSLRVHELGHALGYSHVTRRESVMNSSARSLPNEFDLQAARIAFLRPPGNRSPDVDPDHFTINIRTGVLTWFGDR